MRLGERQSLQALRFDVEKLEIIGVTSKFISTILKCFSDSRSTDSDLFSFGRLFLFILLPKKLFLKFLCMPIELKQKSAAVKLIESYPLLELITQMTRATQRISMTSLVKRFDSLKQKGEICFKNGIVRQLSEFSSRKFEDTSDYLLKLDHIS